MKKFERWSSRFCGYACAYFAIKCAIGAWFAGPEFLPLWAAASFGAFGASNYFLDKIDE